MRAPSPRGTFGADARSIVDAEKTLSCINEEAGTKVQGDGLRATFASIAEELTSSALLKRMCLYCDAPHRQALVAAPLQTSLPTARRPLSHHCVLG